MFCFKEMQTYRFSVDMLFQSRRLDFAGPPNQQSSLLLVALDSKAAHIYTPLNQNIVFLRLFLFFSYVSASSSSFLFLLLSSSSSSAPFSFFSGWAHA